MLFDKLAVVISYVFLMVNSKLEPFPISESTLILPPRPSIKVLTVAKPIPCLVFNYYCQLVISVTNLQFIPKNFRIQE